MKAVIAFSEFFFILQTNMTQKESVCYLEGIRAEKVSYNTILPTYLNCYYSVYRSFRSLHWTI